MFLRTLLILLAASLAPAAYAGPLVSGQRHRVQSGRLEIAVLATSAMPGARPGESVPVPVRGVWAVVTGAGGTAVVPLSASGEWDAGSDGSTPPRPYAETPASAVLWVGEYQFAGSGEGISIRFLAVDGNGVFAAFGGD